MSKVIWSRTHYASRDWRARCRQLVRVSFTAVCLAACRDESNAAVDWPTIGFTQIVTNTFSRPTCIGHAGDGTQRMFVTEQLGRIQIIQSNTLLPQPFLTITNRVLSTGAEQGLLGLAFPPGFSTNGHFYVHYTRVPDGAVVVSRFQVSSDANIADTNSEQVIKVISKSFNNHNGGQLAFGPDGYLYIGVGDGGSEGDPQLNGQKKTTLLGKLLRIDVESGATPYAVPANNPFVGNTNYLPEIWALGLRNPWRFSFDRLAGDLYIGDVGQNRYEEIDFQAAGSAGGQNYGWRIMEAATNYQVPVGFTNFSSLTLPLAWYDHLILPTDLSASITGGYVYRGPSEPRMDGLYFYGDFIAGWMWALKRDGTNWLSLALVTSNTFPHFMISTFGEDESGRLYMADYYPGKIYQIQDTHQAWAPVFSPTNGIVNSNTVMITCATPGAEIHYTTNGIDPAQSDPVVASGGTITVTTGLTNKARAFRADLSPSVVTRAIFTNKVGTPKFSPGQTGPGQTVVTNGTLITISTVTPAASLYYTMDSSNPTTNSTRYSGPITFSGTFFELRAFGVATGFLDSAIAGGNYALAQVATPIFSPQTGPITNGTALSISCATPGATIYYTTNGSTPTTGSAVYSSPLVIQGGTRVKAMAAASNYMNSAVRDVLFDLLKVSTPVFNPPQGPAGTVAISCATPNATICYTLDGTDPTTNSAAYSSPITLSGRTTVTARGFRSDLAVSDPAAVTFGLLIMEKTVVTTFAGSTAAGFSNAARILARFSSPRDVCFDPAGNLYVADWGNNVIRKIAPSGAVSTFAGSGINGSLDGPATNAQFAGPAGICADSVGNFYVAEAWCSVLRTRKIDSGGNVTTVVPNTGDCYDYRTLEVGPDGNLYIGASSSVQEVFATNGANAIIAGPGSGWTPSVGIAIDALTNVYAATEARVWKLSPGQTAVTFAGSDVPMGGFSDGPRLQALFQGPLDAHVDSMTNLYVSDRSSIRKISPGGIVTTMAGKTAPGYLNGRGMDAIFGFTSGICSDTNGNIYVADAGNNCIRKISPDTAGIGIADDWQIAHFGHVGIDPNDDPDHDGMTNLAEFWAGTDPLNAGSSLTIDSTSIITNGHAQIRWQTVAGKSYTVQYSADLKTWNNLGSDVTGDGSMASVTDSGLISQSNQRYYRVLLTGF